MFICFSSPAPWWRKLFHTSSPQGETYGPETWAAKLGLPGPEELGGLEVSVKSLFFRPWGVLHAKYLIVDRERVLVPSCNVSWEEWFEGCVELEGEAARQVFGLWKEVWVDPSPSFEVWDPEGFDLEPGERDELCAADNASGENPPSATDQHHHHRRYTVTFPARPVRTTLLPHIPPRSEIAFHTPLPFPLPLLFSSLYPDPPPTPLNSTLLTLFATAEGTIILLTPNFTSPPVYHGLLAALKRGVDVRLVTNRRMMVFEQLFTAGGLTEWWVSWLRREYRRLRRDGERRGKGRAEGQEEGEAEGQREVEGEGDDEVGRMEEGRILSRSRKEEPKKLGRLRMEYFRPFHSPSSSSSLAPADQEVAGAAAVKTHLKLTLVDDEIVVLGSGNMDRASWYTSQELGVMLTGKEVAGEIWGAVERALEGRLEEVCSG